MKPFERRNRAGGRDSRQKESSFGGGHPKMGLHQTICAQCGMSCEVPFKPSGERPVLCNACFNRDDRPHRLSHMGDSQRIQSGRPERSDRFERSNAAARGGSDQVQKQLAMINAKLNKILELLGEIDED